jgi:hypothetical protein
MNWIDREGRIFINHIHVGYARKGLSPSDMHTLCNWVGCEIPMLQDDFIAFEVPKE